MKRITKLSITKLSFIIVITVMCFLTCYAVIATVEDETLKTILNIFSYAVTSMISFYFWQKVWEMKEVDSLIKQDENKE